MPRLYLDNAATSFPKPPGVVEAMVRYAREVGASPGRGQYAESREGARVLRRCRERLATLLNAEGPERIVFALNTSDALNLAIKGVFRAWRLGATNSANAPTFITTAMDHNSVLRPFQALAEDGARLVHVRADPLGGVVSTADVVEAMDSCKHAPLLVAANMASNVSGAIQPIAEIGRACRARGVLFLVDAAQALGHIPVDVQALHADLVAFPGHKGLMGPQGTGGLYIRPGVETRVATTREGGTGSWSEQDAQPPSMPERYEAGSHNTVGIAGLSEACAFILKQSVQAMRLHELDLIEAMLHGLHAAGVRNAGWPPIDGPCAELRLLGPVSPMERVGVFGLVHDRLDPAEMAVVLENDFGILARAGLTCAPRAHETFGTQIGGSLRLSIGAFNTRADINRVLAALRSLCEDAPRVHPARLSDALPD